MALGKFSKPGTSARSVATRARKSRYAEIKAAVPRDPMPPVGDYRFRIESCEEGKNPGTGRESFKIHLVVEGSVGTDALEVGEKCVVVFITSGECANSGLARVKAFVVAAAGYEDEDAFEETLGNDGQFIDAVVGEANEWSENGPPLDGRLVDCSVKRGKTIPESDDYYREYEWYPVGDEEQG